MDFNYLPESLKSEISKYVQDKSPISILRTSGALNGNSGEGYVISYDDTLLMFSRELGESDYQIDQNTLANNALTKFEIRNEKYNCFLDIKLGGKTLTAKFSRYDEKDVTPMLDIWKANESAAVPPPIPETPATSEPVEESVQAESKPEQVQTPPPLPDSGQEKGTDVSPIVGLGAALMYLALVDEKIDKTEDDYIRYVCRQSNKILKAGLQYQKTHTFEQLLEDISYIDHHQRLCMLANLVELGMSDGVLHKSEQKIIKKFAAAMNVSKDEYQAVYDVLLIKNQISCLSE